MLEAVLASLQGQWMQQIFLGGIKVADPVTSAVTPNLAHQLRWHRFVNTRGGMVHVIFEHVNKLVKTFIQECEV